MSSRGYHNGETSHNHVATQWLSKPTVKQYMKFIDTTFRLQSGSPRQVCKYKSQRVYKGFVEQRGKETGRGEGMRGGQVGGGSGGGGGVR